MGRTSKRIAVWVLAAAALAAAAPGGSGAAEEGRVERPEPGVFSMMRAEPTRSGLISTAPSSSKTQLRMP